MSELELYALIDEFPYKNKMNNFDCGNSEINYFFQEGAIKDSSSNIMRTKVLYSSKDEKIIGFFSLNTAQVKVAEEDLRQMLTSLNDKKRYSFPTVQLSFFAIDKNYHRQKYGTLLLLEVFRYIISISGNIGCVGLSLSSTYDSIQFYEGNGFSYLDNKPLTNRTDETKMFMDLPTMQSIINESLQY